MDCQSFIEQFQDYLAPRLDTYEQALYLYIFRHSRFIDADDVVIGFKSARTRMACGIGEKGKPMSETSAYKKLQSLKEKGCLEIITSERLGSRIRLNLPDEIPGLIPATPIQNPMQTIEEMDFFTVTEHRTLILEREDHQCFYCLCKLTAENYVIEHVISRPEGNNSYRNVVAACRKCNNRKDNTSAEHYMRILYRESFLSAEDLQNRIEKIVMLKNGEFKPPLKG